MICMIDFDKPMTDLFSPTLFWLLIFEFEIPRDLAEVDPHFSIYVGYFSSTFRKTVLNKFSDILQILGSFSAPFQYVEIVNSSPWTLPLIVTR